MTLSPCHKALLYATLGDGVLIGWCKSCNKPVVRDNPRTGIREWLDGKSPWTEETLRPVEN